MIERLVETEQDRDLFVRFILRQRMPFVGKVSDGRSRSLDQNRTQFLWASEVAQYREGMTAADIQREWKAMFAAPLYATENEKFAAFWSAMETKLTHEERVEWMRFIPVTSLMSMKLVADYLDEVYRYTTIDCGIKLTKPEDLQLAGIRVKA